MANYEYKLVVEFTSLEEMLDFRAEVNDNQGINSYAILSAEPYRPGATNTINGDTTGRVVQADTIDGGVRFP